MYVVAVTRLGTSIEDEAKALAADLGSHAYDERQKLAAGMPAVVLLTEDDLLAQGIFARLGLRGHTPVLCSSSEIVPMEKLVSLRRFALEPDALVATDVGERLPWSDITALVRAVDQREKRQTSLVSEKKFNLGRALATSGLISSKTTKKEVTTSIAETEQVLYVFHRAGEPPWLLREQGTHWSGLPTVAPSTILNLHATVAEIARRSNAKLDERLVTRRRAPRGDGPGSNKLSAQDLDLLAFLVAKSVS